MLCRTVLGSRKSRADRGTRQKRKQMQAAEGTSAVSLGSPASGSRLRRVCSLSLATLLRATSRNISKGFVVFCSLLVIDAGRERASAWLPRGLESRALRQQRLKD